ncbi:MAG: hypothetical protein JNL51_19065 [Chitinophagaceae bacterium]|nr:hypothetical protein [Chitinophagaceae bacterium]
MAANQSFNELFRFKAAQQEQVGTHDQPVSQCPSCSTPVKPGADICESCGQWLLEGKCNFCYADFKRDQKFCSACGNPPAGITCKNCGTLSHFDFCPKCNTALSKKAAPALKALLDSPEIQLLKELRRAADARRPADKASPANQLQQLNAYLNSSQKSPKSPLNPFGFTGDNKDFSEELENSRQSMIQIGEENRAKEDDAELKIKIKELQEKAFSDNQSARLYYTSIKLMLPELKSCSVFLGWKCNYANFIHYLGPSDCACPGMGGHWVCKDDVQQINGSSFVYDGLTYYETNETDSKGIHHD